MYALALQDKPLDIKERLDEVEKNLTESVHDILSDESRSWTYGRMREAMHKLHGLVDILLWEKNRRKHVGEQDSTRVERDSFVIECE